MAWVKEYPDKLNNTATLESLINFVCLLLTDDKETFVKAYKLATHDIRGGNKIWYLIEKQPEMIKRQTEKRRQKRQEAKQNGKL